MLNAYAGECCLLELSSVCSTAVVLQQLVLQELTDKAS